jgi:poly(rC)-binding protein 3/4
VAHEKKKHDLCFGSTEKKEILKFALIFGKVIIFGREQLDEPLPPAMDALLRVYQQTINNDSLDVGPDNVIVRQILAPSEQAASLIGEHGVMINSIMEASQTDIRVLGNLI